MLTRTKINGRWVNDPVKDYSAGNTANHKTHQPGTVNKLMNQNQALLAAINDIKSLTKSQKVHERINALREQWPSL